MSDSHAHGFWDSIQEGWKEGRADLIRRTTPVSQWSHFWDEFSYSQLDFYARLEAELKRRQLPDAACQYVLIREATVFSRKRLYLEIRRDRHVFQIMACSFGIGWFVSSRLYDRRRFAKLGDFLFGGCFLGIPAVVLIAGLYLASGPWITTAVVGTVLTLLWSVLRFAAAKDASRLDDALCGLPVVGRLYEATFHPETYYRVDQRTMYREVVHRSLMSVLAELSSNHGLPPLSEEESRPILRELT